MCNTLCHLNGVWPIKAITSYTVAFILSLGIIWNKRACPGVCGCFCVCLYSVCETYCMCTVCVRLDVYYPLNIFFFLNPWPPYFHVCLQCEYGAYFAWCVSSGVLKDGGLPGLWRGGGLKMRM